MAGFSSVTLTGSFGVVSSGTLTFTLTMPMANDAVIAPPIPVVITLDDTGSFSEVFYANGDPDTIPQGAQYGVTEVITGAPARDYTIAIPPIIDEINGTTTLDSNVVLLSSAVATPRMVGQSITGDDIPDGTTIVGVQVGDPVGDPFDTGTPFPLNSVQISAPASGTSTGLDLTIGETIDLSQLMPGTASWN